ncbi:hypothetical protein J7J26_04215 [Candidatus Micrarchaeota archaeon]|nr:hypothetical protein [Candidatus Micrarchaeota archaeon]
MEMKIGINRNHLLVLVTFGILVGTLMAFATGNDLGSLVNVFNTLTCDILDLLIPISFLLVVAAAVIYAAGQVGSAEMRGKSQSWAIWALVGAVVAFAIKVIGPMIVCAMYCSGGGTCTGLPSCLSCP